MLFLQMATEENSANLVEALGLGTVVQTKSSEQIATAVQMVTSGINLVAQSTEKIRRIAAAGRDVADQTYLLVLNSSSKTMQAGEYRSGINVGVEALNRLADSGAAYQMLVENLHKRSEKGILGGAIAHESLEANNDEQAVWQKVKDIISAASEAMSQQIESINQLILAVTGMNQISQAQAAAIEAQPGANKGSKPLENVHEKGSCKGTDVAVGR